MMKELLTNPKTKFILVIIGLLLIFNIVLSIYRLLFPATPTLSDTIPINKSKSIELNQNLIFIFKEPVLVSDLSISSVPLFSWQLSQTNKNTITATHALDFQPSTTYTINLMWKTSPLPPLTFTTMVSQTDSLLIQNMKDELARDYPLAQLLPYNSDLYRVIYSAPMTLEITIKNENILPEKAFSDIRAWVTSVSGDADAHKYVISDQPLPSSTPTGIPENRNTGTPSPSPTPFNWDTLQDDGT